MKEEEMIRRTYKRRRLTVAIALAISLAAWGAPSALAFDGRSPDTRDAAGQANGGVLVDGRSPDTLDAAGQAKADSAVSIIDVRSPDARDAADYAQARPFVDLRSPDARDGAFPVIVSAPKTIPVERFHWSDFGIGVGTAFGSMLLIAGLAAGTLVARQKRGPATA
jgi:hypothetical protein